MYNENMRRRMLLMLLYEAWNNGRRGLDLEEAGSVLYDRDQIGKAISYFCSHGLIKPWVDQGEVYILTDRGVSIADLAERSPHASLDDLLGRTANVTFVTEIQGNHGPVVVQQGGYGSQLEHRTTVPVETPALSHGNESRWRELLNSNAPIAIATVLAAIATGIFAIWAAQIGVQGKESSQTGAGAGVVINNPVGGQVAGTINNIGTQPRFLDERAAKGLIEALAPYKDTKITVTAVWGDPESLRLASQFKQAFVAAGWSVDGVNQAAFDGPMSGLILRVPSSEPVSQAVLQAIHRTGLKLEGQVVKTQPGRELIIGSNL